MDVIQCSQVRRRTKGNLFEPQQNQSFGGRYCLQTKYRQSADRLKDENVKHLIGLHNSGDEIGTAMQHVFALADRTGSMILRIVARSIKKIRLSLSPAIKLASLVTRAHQGAISVEELSTASISVGRFKPLVKTVADVLLDLKQQRAERAALEQEIRDRIANRTDALERRIGSLQVQATRDALTGLNNRRGLDTELPRVIEHHLAGGTDVCLLMIDVDHFKLLNDTLGHPAGDQLLKEIGQLIRSTLRGNDQAYRFGGDEFIVLLDGCNLTAGQAISRRLEQLVRELTKTLPLPCPPQLSIGPCALSELQNPTPQSLLKTADTRLYAVKATRPRTRKSA